MSLLQNSNAIPTKDTGYKLTNSLRFRRDANTYLSRTFGTPTSNTTWTWSSWNKLGDITNNGNNQYLLGVSSYSGFAFAATNYLGLWNNAGATIFTTPNIFRDISSWYHIMYVANGTSVKIYVNGELIYTYGSAPPTNINSANLHRIGDTNPGGSDYDGYMTEIHFVDGQALTPSDFGEYNSTTGTWQPIEYVGTYGNNGFYLENGRGTDQSGNGNNWTETNFNTTTSTATSYDIMTDVPTLTDENTGNFCVLSSLNKIAGMSLVEGNLKCNTTGGSGSMVSTMATGSSGKYYAEFKITAAADSTILGIVPATYSFNNGNFWGYSGGTGGMAYYYTGIIIYPGGSSSYGASYTTNDVIGVAIDMDAGEVTFYKNGVSQGVAQTGLSGNYYFAVGDGSSASNTGYWANFGQRPYAYTPPTGFKKVNTYNLPDSAVKDGSEYFDTKLWTGNDSGGATTTQSITGLEFSPDLVWVKRLNTTSDHTWGDTVRGVDRSIFSNRDIAERYQDSGGYISSFNSDGFTVQRGSTNASNVNNNGDSYVGWSWRGSDSAPVTDSSGTIGTVTRSTNTTSGFSVVTYTGTGTSGQTIPHGLGVTPSLIITKRRDTTNYSWVVMPGNSSLLGGSNVLFLNTTDGLTSNSAYYASYPSSSYYYSSTGAGVNAVSGTYVSYVFAEVEGFSKFGTYTGNGSSDGPFIHTGFDVKFLMYKSQTAGQYWVLYDNTRDQNGNPQSYYVLPSTSDAQGTSPDAMDFLSNGFKIRYAGGSINTSGQTHIYMAFAENPFKNSLAR